MPARSAGEGKAILTYCSKLMDLGRAFVLLCILFGLLLVVFEDLIEVDRLDAHDLLVIKPAVPRIQVEQLLGYNLLVEGDDLLGQVNIVFRTSDKRGAFKSNISEPAFLNSWQMRIDNILNKDCQVDYTPTKSLIVVHALQVLIPIRESLDDFGVGVAAVRGLAGRLDFLHLF